MSDWNKPVTTDEYVDILSLLKGRDENAALAFDPAFASYSNLPENTVRWNSANGYWEKKDGVGAWNTLIAKYMIDVDTLDGQHGAYYLDWNNFTNKPSTFAPSTHNHDDRYYTETEADSRFGGSLANNGNQLQLLDKNTAAISTLTVTYASNAGNANTVAGFSVNQNLRSTDDVAFGSITVSGLVDGRDVAADGSKLDGVEAGAEINPTPSEILTDVKTVDGAGSGLDADQLDGQHGSFFRDASNMNAGTLNIARIPETSSAQFLNNTPDKVLSTDQVWGAMSETVLTDGATIAWDMHTGIDFKVTLAGNRTLGNPTNVVVGRKGRLRIVQGGAGSRTLTLGSNFKTPGGEGITLTTAAAAEDYLYYDCRSTTCIVLSALLDVK